ncbi:MAG: hypothetical protein ABL934_09935 [Lysobacteraceae bacterium]
MKKGLLIAMLLSLPFSATAQNEVAMEEYLDGEIMHVLPNGELATLHYKNGMPLPESTDRVKFVYAGPSIKAYKEGPPPVYSWSFALDFTGTPVPLSVKIDSVGEPKVEPLIDERIGMQNMPPASESWAIKAFGVCTISRKESCSDWMFESQPHVFVFKATILYIDGKTETLYQGSMIDPRPIVSQLGL